MTSHSSLVFWRQKEILPLGIFLTSSDSGGDRVLFWHSSPHMRQNDLSRYSGNPNSSDTNIVGKAVGKDRESAAAAADTTGCPTNKPHVETAETNRNPFALNLISDRLDHLIDLSASPTGPGPGADRLGGASASGVTNVSGSLAMTAAGSATVMGPTVGSGPVGSFGQSDGTVPSGMGLEHARFRKTVVEPNGLSSIEGLPTNILLGLLHQQTQEVQRRIYIKLDNRVFIGAVFNLTSDPHETSYSDSDTESPAPSPCHTGHSLISFSVVFAMDAFVPPSVLSLYSELARLTGTQIRRAELVFHYLSKQRNIIISTVDRTSPGLGYSEDVCPLDPISSDADSGRIDVDGQKLFRSNHSSSSRRSQRSGCVLTSSEVPGGPPNPVGPSESTIGSTPPERTTTNRSTEDGLGIGDFPAETTLDQIARLSSLCTELKTILDSVCLTGHVAVMIHDIYPVYFCLPHMAYSLVKDPIQPSIPAIRPIAVWRAMDHIRPYHALLLLSRREDLVERHIPPDINATMFDFVSDLSPTLSLHNMSVRMHSQLHCLSLALWLVYRGHALIVYPIVANNTYVLSPHATTWLGPQLIGQFASMFPTVNLAQLLASFSTGLTLKDFVSAENTKPSDNTTRVIGSQPSNHSGKLDLDSDEAEHFWTNLSYIHKVELITWLLRRRLIIQVHIYVFSTLTPADQNLNAPRSPALEKSTNSASSPDHTHNSDMCDINPVFDGRIDDSAGEDIQLDQFIPKAIWESVPKDLARELCQLFPASTRAKAVQTVLMHPGATQNLTLLRLFCRIHPRLPAHLEELMFVESEDRTTLVSCIERFNPILCTARLPDPVTACFAGVGWPD